jgi:peptide deformylase
MKLPIIAYGDPILRKKASEIEPNHADLDTIIANMFETMYAAHGVGLAAPQVGLSIRLFIVDAKPFAEDEGNLTSFKKIFVNPQILEETGDTSTFNEGCLSIPDIREDIERKQTVRISYLDEQGKPHEEIYTGIAARIIQHEYDHIEGKLFVDKLSPLRKAMLKGKLENISKGLIKVDYKMKFPAAKNTSKLKGKYKR